MLLFKYFNLNKYSSVIFVPLSKQRLNKRGFNHVELLAKPLLKYFNEPISISRTESTRALHSLDRDERRDEMSNVFLSDKDFTNKKYC